MNKNLAADRQDIIAAMRKSHIEAFIIKISDTQIDYNAWLIKRQYGKKNKILNRRCPDHPHYGFLAAFYLDRHDICRAYHNGLFHFRIYNDDLMMIRCSR